MSKEQTLLFILDALESEMQTLSMWQTVEPSAEALASTEPFAVDTLSFAEWVQWIMIPLFRKMVRLGQPLPTNSDIQPMAEEAFKVVPHNTQLLISLIGDIDTCLRVPH
jgi:uncharacterized protein YqcC (DUF446 family)